MTDDPMREFARRLFHGDADDRPPMPPRPAGHVAAEGQHVPPAEPDDQPTRNYVADLFGIDLNARGLNTTALDS